MGNNTRTNGIVLVLTLLAVHILILARKNRRVDSFLSRLGMQRIEGLCLKAHILPYLVFAIGTVIISIALPVPAKEHISFLHGISKWSICHNAVYYAHLTKDLFPFSADFALELYGIFALFFIYGLCRNFAKSYATAVYSIYIAGTLAMYILWPFLQGIRFIMPILPLCAIFAGLGIRDALSLFPQRVKAVTAVAGLLLLFNMSKSPLYGSILYGSKVNQYGAYTTETAAFYRYIRKCTKQDDIVMSFKPRVLYLETGRLCFQSGDIARLRDADYLLLSADGYGTFDYDIEAQYPKESKVLQKIMEGETLKLYKINK